MSRGSIHNFLHKQKGAFKLPTLLKVAVDVSKGMNYLHQNNIIHRDLKTANLLMDEHGVSQRCIYYLYKMRNAGHVVLMWVLFEVLDIISLLTSYSDYCIPLLGISK